MSAQASDAGRIAISQNGVAAAKATHEASVAREKAANSTTVVKSADEIIRDTNASLSTELPGADSQEQASILEEVTSKYNRSLAALSTHDLILSKLHAPVDLSSSSKWYVQEGSPYHFGIEEYAIDLNQRGSAQNDMGEPVFAMFDGTVVYIDEVGGRMFLRSEIENPLGGSPIVFYQEFVHMQNMRLGLLGQDVATGTQLGEVGRVAADANQLITSHLHVNVIYDGVSLDLRPQVKGAWQLKIDPPNGSVREIGGIPSPPTKQQLAVMEELTMLWKGRRQTEGVLLAINTTISEIHNEIDAAIKTANAINIIFTYWADFNNLYQSETVSDAIDTLIIHPVVGAIQLALPGYDLGQVDSNDVLDLVTGIDDFVEQWRRHAAGGSVGRAHLVQAALFAGTAIQKLIAVSFEYYIDLDLADLRKETGKTIAFFDQEILKRQFTLIGRCGQN